MHLKQFKIYLTNETIYFTMLVVVMKKYPINEKNNLFSHVLSTTAATEDAVGRAWPLSVMSAPCALPVSTTATLGT